jgi:hypothetical protein
LDTAYIFGNTGNLTTGLGRGWSVEDEFAWAVGHESELTLPLQGGDVAYVLRLDIHPAIFPPKVPRQRLMIRAGKTVLGSFELTARETLAISLPVELTADVTHLELTLIHPDAVRPRDHLPVDDSRHLALCFHSASLARQRPEAADPSSASDQPQLEPVHGLIGGGPTAQLICEIISKLPALKSRFGMRFLDLSRPLEEAIGRLPPETIDTAQFCWLELNASFLESRDRLRRRLPTACAVRTFYSPIIRSLWPFQGPDSRAVAEPGRYDPSRYPYGDRLAHALSVVRLPDDVLYAMYETSSEQEKLDLDEIFANDLRRWRAEGRKTDMRLADFIERHISAGRVFIAPNRVGPILIREMVDQVLDDGLVRDVATPEALSRELDVLLEGYRGWQEEIPVHKRVAEHFKLSWWSPDMTYRWMNNLRTHREHVLDTIKWAQWRT